MYHNRKFIGATAPNDSFSSVGTSGSCSLPKRTSNFNGGRRQSHIWRLFTDADSPHKLKSAVCKHCQILCAHYKKSENARQHLLKCPGFRKYVQNLDDCDVPEWYTRKMNSSSDADGLRHLLDPRYIGEKLDRKLRHELEDLLLYFAGENGQNEGGKYAMYDQIKDYTIAANIEKQNRSFRYEMLIQGKKTPLEYWLTDGASWPMLQEVALELFSPTASSTPSGLSCFSSLNINNSKLRNRLSDDTVKKEPSNGTRMSTEQSTPESSRPKRRASLQSVSMIKNLVASVSRRKRKAPADSDIQETIKKDGSSVSKQSSSPIEVTSSLADLDETLFPSDNGLEYRISARLRAQDEFGKWYTAKIIDINRESGEMLIHFDYWSQRYDEWIPANSDRLTPLDNVEMRTNSEPLQVGDFVFARSDETGTYPAQIVEFLESDRYKLLYYDGFEKAVHRRNLKKMTNDEVKQLDLVNFGRLKILPTYPNVMFDPNLAGKLHDLGSRRRSSKNASLGSSTADSPKCDTPLSTTDDDRMTPKVEPSNDRDAEQVVDKATMKPLPRRKSLNVRSIDKSPAEKAKQALSKSKCIVEAAKKFRSKRQRVSTSDSSLALRPDSSLSSQSKNSDDSVTLSNIKEQQMDELPLQNFLSKKVGDFPDLEDRSIDASTEVPTDTTRSSRNNSVSTESRSTKKTGRSISSSSNGTSQCLSDEALEAKSWVVGRESWLKHDPLKKEYFCIICRAFYPKGNAGRCGRFLDGIPLSHFSIRRVRDHENSSMHGRAVVWWNIDNENEPVPLLSCNGYYLERREVPSVKKALEIGQKSKDNNFKRILFCRKKNNRQIYAECQSDEVTNEESEVNSTISPKKVHFTPEQPRKIADNDSIYWLRQDKESIFCSACRKYSKSGNVSPKCGIFDQNSDNATYSEHGKLPEHHEALKQMFVEQNCMAQRHIKRLEKQRKELESNLYNCPASFCHMNFLKNEDLESHVTLVHRRNADKEKHPIISCVCDINEEDDAMIQCFQCSTLQHRRCFDIQQNCDLDSFYCCYLCADDNESATSVRVEFESDIAFALTGRLPSIDRNFQVLPASNDVQMLNTCYQDVLEIFERLNHMDRQMKSMHSTTNQAIGNEEQFAVLQEEMDKKLDDINQIVSSLQEKCPQRMPIDKVRDLQKNLKSVLSI